MQVKGRAVRHMDAIGAGDVAIGQVWFKAVDHSTKRHLSRIEAIEEDRVTLRRVDNGEIEETVFGSLLALWVLAEEADCG